MLQWLNIPEWVPWWVPLALLVPALLWALSFLLMPFSVIGVKSRLELIEARLDEIQGDLRQGALRPPLPSTTPAADYDEVYPSRMQEPRVTDRVTTRPPIPPARHELFKTEDQDGFDEPRLEDRPPPSANARPARPGEPGPRPGRAEPRVDWRR